MKTIYPKLVHTDFDLSRVESTAQRGRPAPRRVYQPMARAFDCVDLMSQAERVMDRSATMRRAA